MKRIIGYIKRAFNFLRERWKRILVLLGVIIVSTFFAHRTYDAGFEFGRAVGHCELACSAMGGSFSGFEYDSHCQCVLGNGFYLNLPFDQDYF
jgi:hypothetical protein